DHLEKLIPMVVKFTSVEDDELREYCFQAFEAFIRRCPKEMSPHVAMVTKLCLKFMTFDPNYNYDDSEEDEDSMDIEDGDDEDDEYSDDDDMSWKVRRSAIKCLEAWISTRRDLLLSFYSSICPALLARFKEREENVRADVFAAFSTLLRQTRGHSSHHSLITAGSELGARIVFCLTDKSTSSTMRIDALSFFHVLLISHPPQAFQPHMQIDLISILPEALSVLGSFLRKNQRALKLSTLACLTVLVTHHAASIKPAALEPVLSEIPPLVDESDMHVSQSSKTSADVLHRQSYHSVARCVAALSSASPKETPGTVTNLIQQVRDSVKTSSSPESARVLALLCLGEVGRNGSLGGSKEVQGVILEAFSSTYEEHCESQEEGTRNLVAECLGKLTLVNPAQLLPRLKQQLKAGTPQLFSCDEPVLIEASDSHTSQARFRFKALSIFQENVKAGSVKQEFEKQEELRRSAMRAVAALLAVPEVERSPSMAEFANQIRSNADMASIYQSVQGGEGGGMGPTEGMDIS
ncbi:hypothetical protein GOODEAATRI_010554, partial [Goodea atripinnis]